VSRPGDPRFGPRSERVATVAGWHSRQPHEAAGDHVSALEALERCRDGAEIALGADVDPDRAVRVLRTIREAAVAVVGQR